MSFPRYPEYKDSGVPWIREVPVHWEVTTAKKGIALLTDFTANGSFASLAENVEYKSSGFARLIRMTDLRSDLQSEGIWIDEHAYSYLSKSALYGGELLMASVGSVGLIYLMPSVSYKASLAPNMYLVKTNERLHSKFLYWFLLSQSGQDQINQAATTTAQPKLNKENVRTLWISRAELSEQTSIATFLDHETAKIDALVAEQEKLIALLQEKRQAVISHAVTKGLDPSVPMKDSGVEWLGEVPGHWGIKRIKHLVATLEQGWSPQCEGYPVQSEEEWGVLKVGCVNGGIFRPEENKVLPPELEPIPGLGLAADDLLISRANTRELVGGAAVALQDFPRLMLCDKLYRLRLRPNTCKPAFLALYLGTPQVRGQIELSATGASNSMLNIGQSTILELDVAVPPLDEQLQILNVVSDEIDSADALVAQASTAITLLQERRTALISAAVTGQIDVRGLASASNAPDSIASCAYPVNV